MHGKLESFSVVCRIHNGGILTVSVHNMLLVDILHLPLDSVVLNVVNDAYSDKFGLVVDPDEQRIINFTILIEETGIVVDSNLHETMKAVVHANWSRIMIL